MNTFQLIQWKHAISMESRGMKHSSGRSVRKFACEQLGLPIRTPATDVIAHIQTELDAVKAGVKPHTGPEIIA